MFLCGIFARNPASEPRIPPIQESFTGASVVDLKFLSFGWHLRSGTSNPQTTLDSIGDQCGFESEIRS